MSGPAARAPRAQPLLVDDTDVPPVPWRNGAGLTRELATGPGWRLNLADLTAPSPFSSFPGSDRSHLPLDGGYVLVVDGVVRPAHRLEPIVFPGEASVLLRTLDRPTKALNLITRRDTCTASLVVARLEHEADLPAYVRAIVPLVGDRLDRLDDLVAEVYIHEHPPATKENA